MISTVTTTTITTTALGGSLALIMVVALLFFLVQKEMLSMAKLCRRDPRLPLATVTEQSLTFLVQFFEGTLHPLLERDLEGAS